CADARGAVCARGRPPRRPPASSRARSTPRAVRTPSRLLRRTIEVTLGPDMAAAPARGRLAAGGAVLALLLAPLGWVATDRLERDDAFCVSCHLPDSTPLHRAKGEDLEARPAATLAAAHAVAGVRGRADPGFRCIDFHGGRGRCGA